MPPLRCAGVALGVVGVLVGIGDSSHLYAWRGRLRLQHKGEGSLDSSKVSTVGNLAEHSMSSVCRIRHMLMRLAIAISDT